MAFIHHISCLVCSVSMTVEREGRGRLPRFCSSVCKRQRMTIQSAQWRLDNPERTLEMGRMSRAKNAHKYISTGVCVICGTDYQCHSSVAKQQKTCGRKCGKILSDRSRGEGSIRRRTRHCATCGKAFIPSRPNRHQEAAGYVQRNCSYECSRIAHGPAKPLAKIRRAVMATSKPIDPIAICSRDGWKCYLCGIETPKSLRGTTDDRAPEVDHIIPLSKDGLHLPLNCSCACRCCNLSKRDRMLPFHFAISVLRANSIPAG